MKTRTTRTLLTAAVLFTVAGAAHAMAYAVTLDVSNAFGYDYMPSQIFNGNYFSYGQLRPIILRVEDQPLREEDFSFPWNSGHRVFYALQSETINSPFTELLPKAPSGDAPSLLSLVLSEVQYTKYYPSSDPLGRTQAEFSLRRRVDGWEYGIDFLIDKRGTSSFSLVDFLSSSVGGNVYENAYREYSAATSNGSIVGGSGFDADISVLSVAQASPVPVPSALALFLGGLAIIGSVGQRRLACKSR